MMQDIRKCLRLAFLIQMIVFEFHLKIIDTGFFLKHR